MTLSFNSVRNLLLPGARYKGSQYGIDLDIVIDTRADSLDLIVRMPLYTRQEIEDRAWHGDFTARVDRLLADLKARLLGSGRPPVQTAAAAIPPPQTELES